jgi:hypothetical protein
MAANDVNLFVILILDFLLVRSQKSKERGDAQSSPAEHAHGVVKVTLPAAVNVRQMQIFCHGIVAKFICADGEEFLKRQV